MPETNPYFTIIIPTYNRANLIDRTLRTILSQTFLNFEVIVVDDGGADDTEGVVKNLDSEKIIYFRKKNGERGAARNFGWEKAKGNYVTFLDSDDILYPNHFEEAYKFLIQNRNCTCYAQAYEIKNALTESVLIKAYQAKKPTINNDIIKGNFLSCFGVFIKKDIIHNIKFEEDRRFAGTEDWLLWLQIAALYPMYYNNVVTGAMLEHPNRSVLSFNEQSLFYRSVFLKQKLEKDTAFIKTYGYKTINRIYAHMLSYTSLHLAISNKKSKALNYWIKALKYNITELMTRRSLAIMKKILFS